MTNHNYDYDGGYEFYKETTVDPGPWLLMGTTIFCFGVMLIIVPCGVLTKLRQRRRKNEQQQIPTEIWNNNKDDDDPQNQHPICNPCNCNDESREILKLAIPYTVSSMASSVFSNICFILVSQHIQNSVKAIAAYALVSMLCGLTDGILQGPLYACTTLCAQAVGAGNNTLAGRYIRMATILYLLGCLPVVYLWWYYMYDTILWLEWGDEITASLAQEFVRSYIWSYVLGGISCSMWQLLEVANHTLTSTLVSMAWGLTNVIGIAILVHFVPDLELHHVAWVYNATALLYIGIGFGLASFKGWLQPFAKGLWSFECIASCQDWNRLLGQAIPLSFGSLLSNAEWTILTIFASVLGPAEVAAWAILGSIWDVFYSVTGGIGDAAELRVSYHLGDGQARKAQQSAYQSLWYGMIVALAVSILYFLCQDTIPSYYTNDATLQSMLSELVPFVGVGNLTMTFGMQCWSILGAQGKYKLATWISFLSSWGITMPLAALYVFVFRIDLQGLTSAVVVGYVSTGAALSYVLLSTNWIKVTNQIQQANNKDNNDASSDENDENTMYASLHQRHSAVAKQNARHNIRLVTIPPGKRSGVLLGNIYQRPGTYVLMVRHWSPLHEQGIQVGDAVLAVDGHDVRTENARNISQRFQKARMTDCEIAMVTPDNTMMGGMVNNNHNGGGGGSSSSTAANDEDDQHHVMVEALAEDESTIAAQLSNTFSSSSFHSGGGYNNYHNMAYPTR